MARFKIKQIWATKLHGSSIIEVTTSMVLVGIIFGIALMIYFNVLTSSLTLQKLKYKTKVAQLAVTAIQEKSFFSEQLHEGDILIHKEVNPYQGEDHILLLHVWAETSGGKILAQYKELIYVKE